MLLRPLGHHSLSLINPGNPDYIAFLHFLQSPIFMFPREWKIFHYISLTDERFAETAQQFSPNTLSSLVIVCGGALSPFNTAVRSTDDFSLFFFFTQF